MSHAPQARPSVVSALSLASLRQRQSGPPVLTPAEPVHVQRLEALSQRPCPENGICTWWDYRFGAFHRGWGLRIDHVLATPPLAARCLSVEVDRDERKGDKPSDHAPLVATFGR